MNPVVQVTVTDATARLEPVADRRPRILIVDDHEDTAAMYCEVLRCLDFDAHYAMSATEAWPALDELRPDAIVLDIVMPGVDGVTLLREVRRDPRTQHLPVLLMTADPYRAQTDDVLTARASALLLKPCPPETLADALRLALAKAKVPA